MQSFKKLQESKNRQTENEKLQNYLKKNIKHVKCRVQPLKISLYWANSAKLRKEQENISPTQVTLIGQIWHGKITKN